MKKQLEKNILMTDDDAISFTYSEHDGLMYITISNDDTSSTLKISLTRGINLGYDMVNICRDFKKEFETV